MDFVIAALEGLRAEAYVPGIANCANITKYSQRDV
jgi:hypothetical protein